MKQVKVHFFNPGHETAVLLDSFNYTPPVNVRRMMKDLSVLPAWYGEDGDLVVTDDLSAGEYLRSLPAGVAPRVTPISLHASFLNTCSVAACFAEPWGLSSHSVEFFRKFKKDTGLNMAVPEWKKEYYAMTGRYTANKIIGNLIKALPETEELLTPCLCEDYPTVQKYISAYKPPYVVKTPFSSSGRGILWVYSGQLSEKDAVWIKGAIKKQGAVTIEKGLDKVVDFAMEFYSTGKGEVIYKGLSVFSTGERGAYSGNRLMSQQRLKEYLYTYVSVDKLNKITKELTGQLNIFYGNSYTGYLGVDMMIYENNGYHLHPCVEINMRYTMGLVAVKVFDKLVNQEGEGDYQIAYFKENGSAKAFDERMKKEHPLKVTYGKIEAGYVSLCPVRSDTHYVAYIVIK